MINVNLQSERKTEVDMIYKRTFSFTDDDSDVVQHLDNMKKGGRSNYIASLIRADMDRNESEDDRIRRIIAEELSKKNI